MDPDGRRCFRREAAGEDEGGEKMGVRVEPWPEAVRLDIILCQPSSRCKE